MKAHIFGIVVAGTVALGGCSMGNPFTTGSLSGGGNKTANVAPQFKNDPTARALHVGKIAARAQKCGYNFDPLKLRTNFLAAEAAQGMQVADLGKIERIYDTAFNGVTKAIKSPSAYCTSAKTAAIKQDLTRHLAGDFTPPPPPKVAKKEEGLLGGSFWGGSGLPEKGPSFGSDDWWEKQRGETSK